MADGRIEDAWSRTCEVLALLANIHRDPKKKASPYVASDFYRPRAKKKEPIPKVRMRDIKHLFVKERKTK